VREHITTALDAFGLLVLAAGVGLVVAGALGVGAGVLAAGAGVVAAGTVVLFGSLLSGWQARRPARRAAPGQADGRP
jgi:hypothetical protein